MEVINMTKTMSLKELRPQLPKVIKDLDSKMDRFIITKRGKPVAVMMAVDDFEGLVETLEIMSDKKLMRDIKKAQADVKAGRVIPFEKIKKDLGRV
jgi:prevent-host-death family protein